MSYFAPTMQLYVERLIDWGAMLRLRRGSEGDVESEVGAYTSVLETIASLAESFERPAREHWHLEATLTEDGGAEPPQHIRDAYTALREAGLVTLLVSEEFGGPGLPALLNGMYLEMLARADASLMTIVGLQTGAAGDHRLDALAQAQGRDGTTRSHACKPAPPAISSATGAPRSSLSTCRVLARVRCRARWT